MLKIYFKMYLKTLYQYRSSFFMTCLGQIVSPIFACLSMLFLFSKFENIKGYSFEQVLVCFSLVWCEYSIAMFLGNGFEEFPNLLSNGQLDRMLLRPMNIIFQIIISRIEISKSSNVIASFAILIYSLINIKLTVCKILLIMLIIFCGSILFLCIIILYAVFCIFAIDGFGIYKVFTDGAKELTQYPINIYKKFIVQFFIYIIPFAMVNYYPFLYIIGKSYNLLFVFLPVLSLFFCIPTYFLWKKSILHFKSTGS